MYPKSMAVAQTAYKTTPRYPGACAATRSENGAYGFRYVRHMKMSDLIVQHFAELSAHARGRYVPGSDHLKNVSAVTKVRGQG